MKRRTFTAEQATEICRRYTEGEAAASIARSYRARFYAVRRVLVAAGLDVSRGNYIASADAEQEMIAAYRGGARLEDVAASHHCARQTVANILKRHGEQARQTGWRERIFTSEEVALMATMAQQGLSQKAIAAQVHASQVTVSRAMRRHGIAPAPRRGGAPRRGPLSSTWKGGRVKISAGRYWAVWIARDAPFAGMANNEGYVAEHRLVMARHLGRPLSATETVHHLNGDTLDNRLENLQLRARYHGKGQAWVCLDCGSHNIGSEPLSQADHLS